MFRSLVVSEKKLHEHLTAIESIIRQAVGNDIEASISADWNDISLAAGLVGQGCEVIARNRGPDVYVAPLFLLDAGIWAWLGLYQEWASERRAGGTTIFSYRSTSLSIHLGFRYLRHKPQIFRAEWSGWANRAGRNYGQQGGNAAHPHWQFDAVESLRKEGAKEAAQTYAAVLRGEADSVGPRVFSPVGVTSADIDEIVGAKDFSRIHFASAAAWWKAAPGDVHAHSPSSESEVEAWVQKTIDYTIEEVERL